MTKAASPQQQVTQLLCDWRSGDRAALEKLIRSCNRSFSASHTIT